MVAAEMTGHHWASAVSIQCDDNDTTIRYLHFCCFRDSGDRR